MTAVNPLSLLALSRAAGCMGTMAYAGALPVLRPLWHMDAATAGAIQTTFNLSNAVALLAAAWLADSLGARRVYRISCWAGALAMLLFALFADSATSARLLIVFVGLTQGASYATALLLAAQLSSPGQRGRAMGLVLAAGSLGYLLSVLAAYAGTAAFGPHLGFGLCALGTALAALTSGSAASPADGSPHDSPHCIPHGSPHGTVHGSPHSAASVANGAAAAPLRQQAAPLRWRELFSPISLCLLVGYVAHCWELLGFWAWTPALLTAALQPYALAPVTAGLVIACTIHVSGLLANLLIGALSDRWTRSAVLVTIGGAGALSSAALGWSPAWGGTWALGCAALASFLILGDSGVLSAAMTEAVAPAHLGKVMGLRSLLGFGAGAMAPLAFGVTLDASGSLAEVATWARAYLVLAAGGAVACVAALCLHRLQGWHARQQ